MPDTISSPTENEVKEITTQKTAQEMYNPLMDETPIVKDYHKANIAPTDIPEIIPEFELVTPVSESSQQDLSKEDVQRGTSTSSEDVYNPSMSELPKKEKRIAAEMAATAAIDSYEFVLANFAAPIGKFDKRKIEKLFVENQISRDLVVETQSGNMQVGDFIETFNEGVDEIVKVDEEFKNKIKTPLANIFEKKAIGMTDEQYVGFEVVKDFTVRIATLLQMRGDLKSITESFIERTNQMKAGNQFNHNDNQTNSEEKISSKTEDFSSHKFDEPIIVDEKGNAEIQNVANNIERSPIDFTSFREPANVKPFGDNNLLEEMAGIKTVPSNEKNKPKPKPRNKKNQQQNSESKQ